MQPPAPPPVKREPPTEKAIALLVADLHLSHKAPIARSAEPDWYEAMARGLKELHQLALLHFCPVICAGDIFDRWNSPPELINFACKHLGMPHGLYAVPGQHDLPYHSYKDIQRSAYWTLVEAGVVTNLVPGEPEGVGPLCLHAFPFGFEVKGLDPAPNLAVDVAVIHSYVWTTDCGYPGAPSDKRVAGYDLEGYQVAVFGDNHIPFTFQFVRGHQCLLYNCGGFYRRKADEVAHRPTVGLLYSDGRIERHFLTCTADKWLEAEELQVVLGRIGLETFVEELTALGSSAIDFGEAVKRLLDREKVGPEVREVVLGALGGKDDG